MLLGSSFVKRKLYYCHATAIIVKIYEIFFNLDWPRKHRVIGRILFQYSTVSVVSVSEKDKQTYWTNIVLESYFRIN